MNRQPAAGNIANLMGICRNLLLALLKGVHSPCTRSDISWRITQAIRNKSGD